MAWFNAAWRYAIGGISDPNSDFDQQTRFALANVPIADELLGGIDGNIDATLGGFSIDFDGTFTPYVGLQLDYDEALSFVAIPEPTAFDVTRRYALGNVGAIGLSDSIDRDGLLDASLGSLTLDFDGLYTQPVFDGALSILLGTDKNLEISFLGSFQFRHYFDVEFSVTPTWVAHAEPATFGDVDITLGGLTIDFDGFALPPDSTQGLIDATLSGLTFDFDGTYTVPPTFTGDVGLDLASLNFSMLGTFVPSGGILGLLSLDLSGLSSDFSGTFEKWSTDGDVNFTLGEIDFHIEGQFTDSSAIQGLVDSNLGGLTIGFSGISILPSDIDVLTAKIDGDGAMKAKIDTQGTMTAKVKA